MTALFERIGGDAAVDLAVTRFYDKVLADDRIRHFFDGIGMTAQMQHQRMFLKYAFGGMPNYPGRAMREAHERLVNDMGLNDSHFDAVIDDLGSALREIGVAEEMVAEVLAIAETTRADVLNRTA